MKTPSNELFQLIHSLKPQEKSYFRQYMSKMDKGKKQISSLFLFDGINKMKTYSEEIIKEEVIKKFHIYDFPKLKNSLSYTILSSLVDFHSSASNSIKLNQILSEVEILVSKNLLSKALSIIKKAKKLAAPTEQFDYLQLLLEFEQSIYSAMNSPRTRNIIAEKITLLEKQKNLLIHQQNRNDIYSFYIKNAEVFGTEDKKLIENSLQKADALPAPISFKAKKQLLNSKALGYYFLNNKKARYKYSKQFVELYDKMGEEAILEDVRNYIVGLTYLMVSQTLFNKHDEVEKIYKRATLIYDKIPLKKRFARINSIFFAMEINYMESLLNQLQFQKVIEIGEINYAKYFKNNLVDPYALMHLCYYIAISNLYLENFRQSLRWLNKVLAFEGEGENRLVVNAKIIRIIIHYELHNSELVLSSATSLIKKLKKMTGFESVFLNFCINKFSKIKNATEEKEIFAALKSKLKYSRKALVDTKTATDFFNYNAWIDFKIQNRPFIEIVRKRTNSV